MPSPSSVLRLGLAAAALATFAACSGGESGHGTEEEHHHAHSPQFGGTLVELGDHFANIEFTANTETGEVELYTWDAHVRGSQRSATEAPSLTIAPHAHGEDEAVEPFTLVLAPRVSKTSGETVGDSSKFTGQHDSMKGVDHCTVTLAEITLKGQTFKDIEFLHPADAHDHDAHDHDGEEHDAEEGHEEHEGEDG